MWTKIFTNTYIHIYTQYTHMNNWITRLIWKQALKTQIFIEVLAPSPDSNPLPRRPVKRQAPCWAMFIPRCSMDFVPTWLAHYWGIYRLIFHTWSIGNLHIHITIHIYIYKYDFITMLHIYVYYICTYIVYIYIHMCERFATYLYLFVTFRNFDHKPEHKLGFGQQQFILELN